MFEKKRGTRFLASVMALVMLLSLAPVGALAAGGGGYGISVNLNETSRGECNVYYAETKSTYRDTSTDQNLKDLSKNGSVTHAKSENLTSYGVIFFVAPHDGYAVEGLGATASAGIYQSIVNDENPRQTDFWTKNSQIENLTSAGFTVDQIEALVRAAKDKGCVAAFIFTRSDPDRRGIDSNLNFTTHQLATFEKSITAVQRGNETYTENLNNVKVRVGDVITYSFKVTFYPDGNNITYSDIVVTDERLEGEDSRIPFDNSSSAGTQTETRNYKVTSDDIRTGKLENTATLTYKYKAPYNVGAVNSTATATATIATVSAVSYQYDKGPRPSDATDITTGDYEPRAHSEGESVTVAANPTGTGYTFSGWTAENASVNDEGKFTMPNAPVIFTGRWTAKKDVRYTVHYLEQGTNQKLNEDKAVEGQTFDDTVTENAIPIEGYTAVGSTSQQVKLNAYDKKITFYYEPNAVTYTVIFNANGGAWSDTTVGEYTVSEGQASRSGVPGTEKITSTSITAPTNQGKVLDGWGYYDNETLTKISNLDLPSSFAPTVERLYTEYGQKPTNTVTLYAIWKDDTTSADSLTYTIKQHYIRSEQDVDHVEIKDLPNEQGEQEIKISELIKDKAKNLDWRDGRGSLNHYVYAASETTVTVPGRTAQPYNADDTLSVTGTVIDLYYYLDDWKDADEAGKDSENGGDGIPDRYQVKILYVSAHQTKGTVSPLEMEIKTIKDANNNFVSKGTVTATGSTATVTDASLYEFVKWTKDTNEVGTNAQLENYRITDAEGGHTYTFTANFKDKKIDPPTSEKAQYTVKHYKWDTQKKDYAFDSEETINSTVGAEVTATAKKYNDGYILNEQKSAQTMSGTVLKDNTLTLDLYYDIDKIGSGNNKDKPDGTPDRYQVTINYVSSNTNWGSVNRSKEVITLINTESGEWLETGTVIAPSCTATSAGGKCYFVNWTKKQEGTTDVSTVAPTAKLPEQTIKNAKGGDVYTFTANFDRSSGGGSGGSNRPKPPVVDIPDDVPTGLNGKDHYAYIIGYGNNDVRPQNNITRAEVATIFFRLLTDETREANMTKSNSYNDVKDGDWFCCAVSTLSKMGIIKGYEDGSFKPNDPISRAEFAAIAARVDPDGDKTPATFADVTSHWAKDEISIAANHGWIKGYEDGSFKPDQKITRAETMTLVNRVLNRLPEAKDDLHKDMKTWVDNMDETAWYYLAVQEATNSHYFKNKTGTKFEQWTDLRDTRDWSELEK